MFLTGLAVLWLWHRAPDQADFSTEVVVLLGTLATASLLAWHAHIHYGHCSHSAAAIFVWAQPAP